MAKKCILYVLLRPVTERRFSEEDEIIGKCFTSIEVKSAKIGIKKVKKLKLLNLYN
jgi:hypothetical protein